MEDSRSRSTPLVRAALACLLSTFIAAPGVAECTDDHMLGVQDQLSIGMGAVPSPTLTLDIGLVAGEALDRSMFDVKLTDITIEGESVTGFRAFLNAPQATAGTSIEDPSYVASFSFFPEPVEGSPAGTFVIDLEPALDRIRMRDELSIDVPLTLTLVPIGADDAQIGLGSSEIVLQAP